MAGADAAVVLGVEEPRPAGAVVVQRAARRPARHVDAPHHFAAPAPADLYPLLATSHHASRSGRLPRQGLPNMAAQFALVALRARSTATVRRGDDAHPSASGRTAPR